MNTTLLIMAAGLGSRYGGNKQVDHIGPNGEILMEYSIYDALEAGFDKVVFVIRRSMDQMFRELIGDKIAQKVEVAYAFQSMDSLPGGFPLIQRSRPPVLRLKTAASCTSCSSSRAWASTRRNPPAAVSSWRGVG